MKNWSAYRKLYLSYACILLIPLVMAFFFYSYSYRVVQRQSDASNINLIRTLKESCDRELDQNCPKTLEKNPQAAEMISLSA